MFNGKSFGQLPEFQENRDPNLNSRPLLRPRIVGILSKIETFRGIFTEYEREIQILDILDIG